MPNSKGQPITPEQGNANYQQYNNTIADALSDPNLDAITKGQLAKSVAQLNALQDAPHSYDSADNPISDLQSNILDTIQAARSGTGVYGVRKLNENQRNLVAAMPGRQQLIAAKFQAGGTNGTNNSPTGQALGSSSPVGNSFI